MIFLTPSRLIVLALTMGVITLVFSHLIPDESELLRVEETQGTLLEIHLPEEDNQGQALFPSLGLIELPDGSRTRLPLGEYPPPVGSSIPLQVRMYSDGERRYQLKTPP